LVSQGRGHPRTIAHEPLLSLSLNEKETMTYQEILLAAMELPATDQLQLVVSLMQSREKKTGVISSRCRTLINKQANCPYCEGRHYYRYGKDNGSQRFKCKDCSKTFT
jgi:hypothetical protein